jgi:hypothetical protein
MNVPQSPTGRIFIILSRRSLHFGRTKINIRRELSENRIVNNFERDKVHDKNYIRQKLIFALIK